MPVNRRPRKVPARGQLNLALEAVPHLELPDKIPANVHTLLIGVGPGKDSALKGHYYPGPGNYLWKLLYESGITPVRLGPDGDDILVTMGFGFTDLAKRPTDGPILLTRAERANARFRIDALVSGHRPRLVVFIGLESLRVYRKRGSSEYQYGPQDFRILGVPVFLVPSTSGASIGTTSWADKLAAFDKLKEHLKQATLLV